MTQITTQWLVEKINAATIQAITLKWKIAEKKQALAQYPENKEIEEMEVLLKEINKEDTELRNTVKETLISAGMKKFEALDGTIVQLNKKPWALVIEDESLVPDEYKKEKITISVDKKQLKEDIKEGVIIEGVSIKEDYTLVIKN